MCHYLYTPKSHTKFRPPWDGAFDVPRPSKVASRFEFCALKDTLTSKSRSFLRRACYPHHTLTDTLRRYPLPTHKMKLKLVCLKHEIRILFQVWRGVAHRRPHPREPTFCVWEGGTKGTCLSKYPVW